MKKLFTILSLILSINVYSQDVFDTVITIKDIDVIINRATKIMPITEKTLDINMITEMKIQQDIPTMLSNTPSIISQSDNGSLVGYTYIRLRGVDQTRINMTLNGVPLNEPEDQGVYFCNYPDFINSINSIQIQRGVGTTSNGASSYIGSLNFESKDLNTQDHSLIGFEAGSFNTQMVYSTINENIDKVPIYFRTSMINSDGYKYHSGNNSYSFFLSTGYKWKNSSLKFVSFLGHQKNNQSWLGVPKYMIADDRRYNSNFDTETDDFLQQHNQLHYVYYFNNKLKISNSIYYNYLNGNYNFDLNAFLFLPKNTLDSVFYNYALKSNFVGGMSNLSYKTDKLETYVGVNANMYNRQHIGSEAKIGQLYDNTGYKNEFSLFGKFIYKLNNFNLFSDIQYRYTDFDYVDTDANGIDINKLKWNFINPKIGLSYINGYNKLYYSIGQTHREPTRTDLFGGEEHLWSVEQLTNIKPESVIDNELGYIFNNKYIYAAVNGYYMSFKDEIVLNGQMGSNSLPLHENVANSRRYGIETDFKIRYNDIEYINNLTLSKNEIIENDNITTHIMSPSFITNNEILYRVDHVIVGLGCKYQGMSYIDYVNFNKLKSFHTLNFKLLFEPKNDVVAWGIIVNNITNNEYLSYGTMDYTGAYPIYNIGIPFNFNFYFKFLF